MNRSAKRQLLPVIALLSCFAAMSAQSQETPTATPEVDAAKPAAEPAATPPSDSDVKSRGLNPRLAGLPTAPPATNAPVLSPGVQPVFTQPVLGAPVLADPNQPPPYPGGAPPPGAVPIDSVVRPGTVQQLNGGQPIVVPDPKLTIWVFANPTARVIGPTAAEISWQWRDGAVYYRILRDGVAIGDVKAQQSSQRFLDAGLQPAHSYTYKIQALAAAERPSDSKRGISSLIEESNPAFVGTPAIFAPSNITASITATGPTSVVRLTWSPAVGAVAYRVFRDGQVIQPSMGGQVLDASGLQDGTHSFGVQSLYPAPNGTQIDGAFSNPVTIRTGPFVAVALGDSIMWGQGLSDSHKFTSRVRDWLQSNLGKGVAMNVFAHSGADLNIPANEVVRAPTPGEVPNTFPTVGQQLTMAASPTSPMPVNPDNVDLVLVDGCINDIGLKSILNPGTSADSVQTITTATCGGMKDFLGTVHGTFKNAKIVLTGYFQIVSPSSDLTAVGALVSGLGIVVAPGVAGLLGIPLDPVTGFLLGLGATQALKDKLIENSTTFAAASTAALGTAASLANAAAGGPWVTYAQPPLLWDNGYAAPMTWLWLVPTDLYPKDEMYAQRAQTCGTVAFPDASQAPLCVEASMGHPNALGAGAYADAITTQLAAILPSWQQKHATVQHAP